MFLYIVLNCHAKTRTFWTRDSEAMFWGLKILHSFLKIYLKRQRRVKFILIQTCFNVPL